MTCAAVPRATELTVGRMRSGSRDAQRGFTYVAVLVMVVALGAGLAAYGELASHARQREQEIELKWIGNQFRTAIGLYYQRTPGAGKRFPSRLEDLTEDRRFLAPQRYLRRVYRDPITGLAEWGLVAAPGGGFMGVHSLSSRSPIDSNAFGATTYSDKSFIYEPPMASR